MSETQTTFQKIGEQTKKRLEKTKDGIQNLLDKMRGTKLGLDDSEKSENDSEDEWGPFRGMSNRN